MWRYYNRNPDKREEEDCVCRAISTALGLRYSAADRLIHLVAERERCEPLCVCCYHSLLEDIFGLEAWRPRREETVGELSRRRDDEKLIIRVDGHLTCSVYGEVLDIWDCSDEIVDCYWVV